MRKGLNCECIGVAFVFLVSLIVFGAGCASVPQTRPQFVEKSFQESPPESIRLVPMLDDRLDGGKKVELEWIRKYVAKQVERRGYKCELVGWGAKKNIEGASERDVTLYLPDGSSPVMVVSVVGFLHANAVLSKTSSASLYGRVFEPGTNKLVWEHEFIGTYEAYGSDIFGVAISPATRSAFEMAVEGLCAALPIRKR